jgi:quinolinate synthase
MNGNGIETQSEDMAKQYGNSAAGHEESSGKHGNQHGMQRKGQIDVQHGSQPDLQHEELVAEINRLKKEKDAVIVAHTYEVDEVQDIADMVGDSLALSRYCAGCSNRVIVFCGVRFMAESAKILSPEKTVLLPELDAGCPMADMVTVDALLKEKQRHPEAVVVCYINSFADVKAVSDICCTSSNAVDVVKSLKEKEVLFIPDKNLGRYVASKVPEKHIIPWDGYCKTHDMHTKKDVLLAKKAHPDALVLVHPECKLEVLEEADFIGSTKQITDYALKSKHKEFIIGTEMGILHALRKNSQEKEFYLMSNPFICPDMKKTSLLSVYNSLNEMKYCIEIDDDTANKAKKALEKMLEVNEVNEVNKEGSK